jgi:hypothetical protein
MRLTLRDMVRRRLLWVVAVLGTAYLSLFGIGLWFVVREVERSGESALVSAGVAAMLMAAGMYVVQFLVVVFALVVSVDTLAGEIASGTVQTLVTRPVSRGSVVAGKLAAHALSTVLFTAALVGAVAAITALVAGIRPQGLPAAIALISLEGMVVLGLTYLGGALAGTLATALAVLMLYSVALIGSWLERIGILMGNAAAQYVGIVCSLIMPTEALWQRAAGGLLPPVLRETAGLLTPFTGANPPSGLVVGYSALYVAACLALGLRAFGGRDL